MDISDAESNIRTPIKVWGLETKRGRIKPVVFRYMWQAIIHKSKGDRIIKGELRRAQ